QEKIKINDVSNNLAFSRLQLENLSKNTSLDRKEFTKQKAEIENRIWRYEHTIDSLKNSHSKFDLEKIKKERDDLESKLKEMQDSINANQLIGPYTISPIELTLDFETSSGETLREILAQTPEVKPFCTTTIFSALDG
ncbi:MAG: hypothetical protein ACO30M_03285, partial [Candidatus Kapaibacteriota bacterium]